MRTRIVRLGSAMVAAGAAVTVLALTGAGNDWLGGQLISCGGRYTRQPCAPGEIPWRLVWQGLTVAVMGVAMLGAPPASVPPPAPATPAGAAGGPARSSASVGPPDAGDGGA